MPELRSVAEDFDRLVDTLRSSADNLRRAAEDNAHAFKTPIAVIRQSLEPLKRIIPGSDGRGPRAIDMIDRSLDRLDGLVSFARRMDEAAADLLEPPRRKVDLSELLEDMLSGYAGLLAERRLHLRLLITPHVVVRAGETCWKPSSRTSWRTRSASPRSTAASRCAWRGPAPWRC